MILSKEQGEALQEWCIRLIANFRIDYFRGNILVDVVDYLSAGGAHRLLRAKNLCFGAKRMSVGRDASSDGAIRECVHEIEGKAGLSPKVTTAISSIILGDWDKAVEGVYSLRGEAKIN